MNEFWQSKTLHEMTPSEWESLCDGCGKCCLQKLLDADAEAPDQDSDSLYMHADEQVFYTDVRCQHLDPVTAQCDCYPTRLEKVPNCVNITLQDLPNIHFMPPSCAYRRLHEGKGLPAWHPLLHQGSKVPMQKAGMSITTQTTISDGEMDEQDYDLRIVTWPLNEA
ncbi:YcgN family cysteine cluster protein [Aliidiomarina sedimenti]|uniref:YcgN family cysteine cluster protein n=1 Tax=Aliidiomarina sedimenti TaxID=1933879 RepID=A0ABY0BX23_9GAMM|nr:YcgN family cysteine cluster protein [Aliidiomarina sedimenti]RUO28909.1 YcgN family cysteine cluster protein [Aliidiomarina sedimenti]